MTLDDLKKLATGSVLFSLDRVIVPRLIRLVYLLGLVGIALWGLDHLFDAFRFGFGNGIWGLIEVLVFGLLAFVALRALCEIVLIYYKANEQVVNTALAPHNSASLIDDVADAIEDLAEEEDRAPASLAAPQPARKSTAKPAAKTSGKPSTRSRTATAKPATTKPAQVKTAKAGTRATPRRTARRTPRPKSS